MSKDKTELRQAFQFARACFAYSYGARRAIPQPGQEAIRQARKLIAALSDLESAEVAAREALAAQAKIDSRRYAPGMEKALADLDKARKAAAYGRAFKYSGPVWAKGCCDTWQKEAGHFYAEKPDSVFRNVTPASDLLEGRDVATGFYTSPDCDGENLCRGFVVQLPSREGRARYAAAYSFEDSDNGGLTADLSRIFESDFEAERATARHQIGKPYWTPAMESPGYWAEESHKTAQKEAARAAQGLAESNAEKEREYQTAWQAGADWQALKEEEEAARAEALALLKERRAARGLDPSGFPALCAALRGTIAGICRDISKAREKRAALAEGDGPELYFSTREERLREAFCDGAGLQVFPA